VIGYESGVTNTVDPLAGSYYIENLTDELENKAREYIKQIDELGGAVAAIEKGFYQREIQQAAWQWQQQIERGERVIVGMNKFAKEGEDKPADLLKVDERIGEEQKNRLRKKKAARDSAKVKNKLAALRRAAAGDDPLMPLILQCVESHCTLGEIADVFRDVWGEYRETVIV
jgi:methylmalonyl-CoA mutase N-terminal domain/subunit